MFSILTLHSGPSHFMQKELLLSWKSAVILRRPWEGGDAHTHLSRSKEAGHTFASGSTGELEQQRSTAPTLGSKLLLLHWVCCASAKSSQAGVCSCFPSTPQATTEGSGNLVKASRIDSLWNAIKAATSSKSTENVCVMSWQTVLFSLLSAEGNLIDLSIS